VLRKFKRFLSRTLFERRFGLDTSDIVELSALNLADAERNNYIPSGWGTLKHIEQHRQFTNEDVFVDFGSGKGRMVFLAAQYPFKRVVGVELSEELHRVAEQNIAKNKSFFKCKDIELVNGDVLAYKIPTDMTIAYFFNPFTGDLFKQVIDSIGVSLRSHPRFLTLVYTNPVMHEYLSRQSWLKTIEYKEGQVGIYETVS
jgi:SAM-dependent methyltransferase